MEIKKRITTNVATLDNGTHIIVIRKDGFPIYLKDIVYASYGEAMAVCKELDAHIEKTYNQ